MPPTMIRGVRSGHNRAAEADSDLAAGSLFILRVVADLGNGIDHDHQHQRAEHAGDNATKEQATNGGVGYHAINNKRHGWGDQWADDGGSRCHRTGKFGIITGVAHGLDFKLAQSRRIGNCRA